MLAVHKQLNFLRWEEGPGRETWLSQEYSDIMTPYLHPTRKPEKQDGNRNLLSAPTLPQTRP